MLQYICGGSMHCMEEKPKLKTSGIAAIQNWIRCGQVGGQAVLGRQPTQTTPWLTERHGYDPT